jgi:hypothetical protein
MDELAGVLADPGFDAGEVTGPAPTRHRGAPRAVPIALGALLVVLFIAVALVQRSGREHSATQPDPVDAAAARLEAMPPDAAVPDAAIADAAAPADAAIVHSDARVAPQIPARKKPAAPRRSLEPGKKVDLEGVIRPDF